MSDIAIPRRDDGKKSEILLAAADRRPRFKKISDRQLLEVAGVTTAQMSALAIIESEEATTQTLLAKELGLNDSAITAMMRRLIDLNLVERVATTMMAVHGCSS